MQLFWQQATSLLNFHQEVHAEIVHGLRIDGYAQRTLLSNEQIYLTFWNDQLDAFDCVCVHVRGIHLITRENKTYGLIKNQECISITITVTTSRTYMSFAERIDIKKSECVFGFQKF